MQNKKILPIGLGLVVLTFLLFAKVTQAADLSDFPIYSGESTSEYAGYSVSGAGDINGDGYDDCIIGAYNKSDAGSGAGAAYVVYGNATDPTSPVNLGSTSNAVEFSGQTAGDYAGYAVAGGGDVNGDGYDDLLVGAYGYDNGAATDAGRVYLIYGSNTALTSQPLGATGQVVFTASAANSYLGRSVAFAGDINGDGYDDIVVGASGYLGSAGNNSGAAFVLYGSATLLTSKNITDSSIIQLSGEEGADAAGWSVSPAGDVNGDGYADFLVGAYGYIGSVGPSSGAAYLIYGRSTTLTAANLSTHVRFAGEGNAIQLGYAVGNAGDVNGDGYDDVLLGAPASSAGSSNAGAVYLVYGSASNYSSATLTSTNSARLVSVTGGEAVGMSVATLGDLNADGYAEFIVGAPSNDTVASNIGLVYFIPGSATPYTSTDLTSIVSSSGISVSGVATGDYAGQSLAAVGDRNHDGVREVMIGAYGMNSLAVDGGGTYLVEPFVDEDGDGQSAEGSLLGGTDCNDADAGVTEEVTYYRDSDGDGEGNRKKTVSECSSVAPDGYVDNSTDTDDTIANNGVEISGNKRDDDDDGRIDEVNTLAENGVHPGYGKVNPKSTVAFAADVISITPKKKGRLLVKYADDSIYRYNIYSTYTGGKKVVASAYRDRGFITVLHPKGKRLKLVNVYSGKVLSTVLLSQTGSYTTHAIKNLDARDDGSIEVVIISTQQSNILVSLLRVNMKTKKMKLYDALPLIADGVAPSKTTVEENNILLKNATKETVATLSVAEDYTLQQM